MNGKTLSDTVPAELLMGRASTPAPDEYVEKETLDGLKAGADPNARDSDGMTALMWAACCSKNPNVIAVLVDAGASVRTKDKDGRKALDFARRNNKLKKSEVIGRLRG